MSSYDRYAALVPPDKLKQVLDEEHGGVDTHLCTIANEITNQWDTQLAPHLGLTGREIDDIRVKHRDEPARQRVAALQLWKKKGGEGATYSELLKTCLDCKLGECAMKIVQLLKAPEAAQTKAVDKIFLAYKKDMQATCEELEADDPDTDLGIASNADFIDLALVKKEQVDENDSFLKSTLRDGIDDIVASKSPLQMSNILAPGSDLKFVLVEGRPGVGKSVFSLELYKKWDTLECLRDYKLVLRLVLRDEDIQKAASLCELLETYTDDSELCKQVENEVIKQKGEGVLFILDGFDELPPAVIKSKTSLIMAIVTGKRGKPKKAFLPKATRLVTTRPSAHRDSFPKECRHIEILGFTDDCKERYAECAFESEPKLLEHFKKFVHSNPVINALMHIPLNCAIAAQVCQERSSYGEQMPKTMTQLYKTLIPALIRRDMVKRGEWDVDDPVPSFENMLEEVQGLRRVCELAYEGLFREDFQLEFAAVSDIQGLGLMKKTTKRYLDKGLVPSFSFLHLSIQEFLAAWYVSCNPDLVGSALSDAFVPYFQAGFSYSVGYHDIKASDTMIIKPHLYNFGLFLAGLSGTEGFPPCPMSYILYSFFESQGTRDEAILSRIYRQENKFYLTNPMLMYVFAYALIHAPVQWRLLVTIPCDMLVSCLADYAPDGVLLGSVIYLEINADCFEGCMESSREVFTKFKNANLSVVTLTVDKAYSNDYLLYQALGNLSHLVWLYLKTKHITSKGLQELSKAISNSSSLKTLIYFFGNEQQALTPSCTWYPAERLAFDQLIVAALSCPTLQSLQVTGIPFKVDKDDIPGDNSKTTLVDLTFFEPSSLQTRFFDRLNRLCSISDTPSVELTLGSKHEIPPPVLSECLGVLNNSLDPDHSMKKITLSDVHVYMEPCNCKYLSRALRRDPAITIKRSRSLCDLAEVGYPNYYWMPKTSTYTDHRHSCPDLLEVESLRLLRDNLREGLCKGCVAPWLSLDLHSPLMAYPSDYGVPVSGSDSSF